MLDAQACLRQHDGRDLVLQDREEDKGVALAQEPPDLLERRNRRVERAGLAGALDAFAPGEGNETTLLGQGGRDNAVARYAADGSLLWARLESSPSEETYVRVAVDAWGSILVAAGFSGEMKVALGQADEMTLTSAGMFDAYVSRYAAGGALIAAWRVGSSGDDYARDVTALPDGSFLVTGSLNDSVTFGAGDPNETTLVSGGGFDIFVARPNADGGF